VKTAVAAGLTAFLLALAIRGGLHLGHMESGWLLPLDFVLHGWPLVAVNVAFYGYLCWLGFWFIRGTVGPERLFMVGWFANILLSPYEKLHPQWAVAIKLICTLGLAVALLAAFSLLLRPSGVANSRGSTGAA